MNEMSLALIHIRRCKFSRKICISKRFGWINVVWIATKIQVSL